MTPLIEFLGSLPRGNQVWIQIIIRAHKAEEKDRKKTFSTWKIWKTLKIKDVWDFMEKKDFMWQEGAKKEIDSILENPNHSYKFLTYDMKSLNRVHIGHFVLVFKVDHQNQTIFFEDYDHHDLIYRD